MRLLFTEKREFSGANPEHLQSINTDANSLELMWFVEQVDEIYQEYKYQGIELLTEPMDEPWGIREFSIRDLNGYVIRISETIRQVSKTG